MKRILLLLLIAFAIKTQAQSYNNEWIDYSKTYYKFKVAATGLYRISQTTLASIGLGATNADHFQLWRNGQQIPVYTSVQNAPLTSSDYIEFWGEMNDGKPDKDLYREPDYQMNDKWSLQTDTAAYFLTVNPAGGNLRLAPTNNDIAGNMLSPEPFFMHTIGKYYRDRINIGRSELVGSSYTYSSSYDYGEGWTSGDIGAGATLSLNLPNLFVYTGAGAPGASVKVNAAGNAVRERDFRVNLNGDSIYSHFLSFYDYVKANIPIDISQISSGSANIDVINKSTLSDRIVVATTELVYPRQFNFGGASNYFSFELPANAAGNYLEIAGFAYSGPAPVLYDLTNGKRYVVDISNPSLLKIALLPSSVDRKLILVNEATGYISNVTSLQQRNLVNYGLSANQGNYLIITSSVFTAASGAGDPVEDYRAYRSSAPGGSYNAKVYLIDQLIDQFGYGIKMHPLSVRNFIRWARVAYSTPLKGVLLIGKGVNYTIFRSNENSPDIDKLCLIPTFGYPASDQLLSATGNSSIPLTPIGRLSVVNKTEISDYLEKVKQYEQTLTISTPYISDMSWRKNIVHVTGASDDVTTDILLAALNGHKRIIEDTVYGGKVYTFSKNSSATVEQLSNIQLNSLFSNGLGILTYFGHSSNTTLELNLENPQNYDNHGKYPIFVVMGCNAGDFFNFNIGRLSTKETISERYILAPQRGSIAFLASTHLGIIHYLDIYNTNLYGSISDDSYGKTIGEAMDAAIRKIFTNISEDDFYARFQCEQFTLHGDPLIKMYSFPKPDYAIEDPLVKISPSFISVAETSFQVKASFMNLGKMTSDSVVVELKRTYPDLSVKIIRDTLPRISYMDSLTYDLPVSSISDKGLNRITITIDPDNKINELYKSNNSVSKDVYIFEDELRPVFPYNFSIINQQNIKFAASTANAFAETRSYIMEMDTTELFNSPLKITRTTNSKGGIVEFTPGLTFTDSTVYYWRVTPSVPNTDPKWNVSSFIYINGSETGFSQAHLYQNFKSAGERMRLDSASRKWIFNNKTNHILARNGVYPYASDQVTFYQVEIDNTLSGIGPGCNYDELIINVINPITFKPWKNDFTGPTGLYGSWRATCGSQREYNFQYLISDITWRNKAMDFINNVVPDGYYVAIRSNTNPTTNTYTNVWKTDENVNGAGISLYHTLLNQGFADIDSFYFPRAWALVFKKNGQSEFPTKWEFGATVFDPVVVNTDCISSDTLGHVTSPIFGPAKAWHRLKWNGNFDSPYDVAAINVQGIDNGGSETTLFTNVTSQDFDISSINADQYPYLKLVLTTQDTSKITPYQLRYWMLTYDPVPEGAIAPNLYFTTKDTVDVGEPFNFGIGFKNVSLTDFDSVKVKLTITDKNNVENIIPVPKQKKLAVQDTIKLNVPVDTRSLSGHNTLFVNFNPDDDQPEQLLFNNYAFRNLYVRPDSLNPLMDVTFDGVHILNRDIVAAKPAIVIKLKDEAKWMALNDTSVANLEVKYPDGSTRKFFFNSNDTLKFIPVGQVPSTDNTATINFNPYFTQDGDYELIVTGKDMSDNMAGAVSYKVAFRVINKPMISNMLNYPNPFTTSTAFIFTLTGSQVPQNIRIQILTITGKVVREITKDELGPLHVGRNITEFKWDGTDQYGQKLANGIYLYRVITNLNGKSLDKYKSSDDNTDKFFNNGYGKMYLMR